MMIRLPDKEKLRTANELNTARVRRFDYQFRSDSIEDIFVTILKEAQRVKEIGEEVCLVPISWLMSFIADWQPPCLAWHRDELLDEERKNLLGDRLKEGLIEGEDYVTISAAFKDDLYKVSAKECGYDLQSDAELAVGILIRTIRNVGTVEHPKPQIILNESATIQVHPWIKASMPPTTYAFHFRRPWSDQIKAIVNAKFGAVPYRLWRYGEQPAAAPMSYTLTKKTDICVDYLFQTDDLPSNFPIRRMTEDVIWKYKEFHLLSDNQFNKLMDDHLPLLAENRASPLRLIIDHRPNILTKDYKFRAGDMFDVLDPITKEWKEMIIVSFTGEPLSNHFVYHEIEAFYVPMVKGSKETKVFDLNYLEHSLAPLHKYTEDRTKWTNGSLILVCGSGGFVAGERELHFSPGIVVENHFERNKVLVRFYRDLAWRLVELEDLPDNAEVEEKWFDLYSPFIRPIDRNLPVARKQWILTLFQPPYRYKQLVEHQEAGQEAPTTCKNIDHDGSVVLKKRRRAKQDDDDDEDGGDNNLETKEKDNFLELTMAKKHKTESTVSLITRILDLGVKSLGTGNECDQVKGILLNILPVIDKKKDSIREIELKKKNLKEKESLDECVFCLSAKKNIVFIPCGHLCVCEGCSVDIHQCPMCRTKCTKKQKVFS